MIPRRKPSKKLILGPRALAVISCALAILTSAPLITPSTHLKTVPSVSITTPKPIQNSRPAQAAERRRASAIANAKADFLAATIELQTRRVHILATVEMFHRWFVSEFRPAERVVMAAFVYEPLALDNLGLPLFFLHRTYPVMVSCLTHEAEFAIYRNLLAPPLP